MAEYPEFAKLTDAEESWEHDAEMYSLGPIFRDGLGRWTYSRSIS